MKKKYWKYSIIIGVVFLIAELILLTIAMSHPNWGGPIPLGRYLSAVFLIGAVVCFALGGILWCIYQDKNN